jgi:tetratricopeptide (TPR) repeat protein
MGREFRQIDEHGFPIPPPFELPKNRDDEAPARPKISLKAKRLWILGILLLVVVPILFGPKIVSVARGVFVDWLVSRAEQRILDGDNQGALVDLDRAIEWSPTSWLLYSDRAAVRQQLKDLPGSLEDYSKSIELLETAKGGRKAFRLMNERAGSRPQALANAYYSRGMVYARMGKGRAAIDDANKAFDYVQNEGARNNRAYIRALVKMELKEGLEDIEQALLAEGENPDFLDTRGYLLHLLDRNEEALKDLNQAVDAKLEAKRRIAQNLLAQNLVVDRRVLDELSRSIDQGLAVLYHHRGLVQEKLGHRDEATEDLKAGDKLGYDPDSGVW